MRTVFSSGKPTWKIFLIFLVPMMLANILQSLSGTLNNIFLGHMIGVQALAAAAQPLARQAVARFLLVATGCDTYVLCHALARFEEVRFRGHTTCEGSRVPLVVVTSRSSRDVISVATWLPSLTRRRRHNRPR